MIISQGFMLWLGNFPTIASHQVDEFDNNLSLDPFIDVELVVGWILDPDASYGTQMKAITVKGTLDFDKNSVVIGDDQQQVRIETRMRAMAHLNALRKAAKE